MPLWIVFEAAQTAALVAIAGALIIRSAKRQPWRTERGGAPSPAVAQPAPAVVVAPPTAGAEPERPTTPPDPDEVAELKRKLNAATEAKLALADRLAAGDLDLRRNIIRNELDRLAEPGGPGTIEVEDRYRQRLQRELRALDLKARIAARQEKAS